MTTINEALTIISNQELVSTTILLPLIDACNHHLSETINAPIDLPPFDNSAMDGYALCGYGDTFKLVGEVAAGQVEALSLKAGEAARIFTGGRVPENTNAVIMQEKTTVAGETLRILDDIVEGKNIRIQGEEIRKNTGLLKKGHRITPATIGVISALGIEAIEVFKKPIVKIITTGSELVQPGVPLQSGQIYESNGFALTAALSESGYDCNDKLQVKDDYDLIKSSIAASLKQTDVLLISGGISVGDYDYVKQALLENGVTELFHKVNQKPGKPLFFGRKNNTFVFGLPGNPASALICFYLYVLPMLHRLEGAEKTGLTKLKLPIAHPFELKSDRPTFFKAKVSNSQVHILDGQSSSMLLSLASSNAIAFIGAPGVFDQGATIDCYLLPH